MRFVRSLTLLAAVALPSAALADTINLSTNPSSSPTGTSATWTVTPPGGNNQNAQNTSANAGWTATIAGAGWINASGNSSSNDLAGTYTFLSQSFYANANASVSGSFASDNAGSVYLFDVTTGVSQVLAANTYASNNCGAGNNPYSFSCATSFNTNNALFKTGDVYELSVSVMNGNGTTDLNGPEGLLLGANATNVSATPEPSSLMLLGTGILGTAAAMRRKLVRA